LNVITGFGVIYWHVSDTGHTLDRKCRCYRGANTLDGKLVSDTCPCMTLTWHRCMWLHSINFLFSHIYWIWPWILHIY